MRSRRLLLGLLAMALSFGIAQDAAIPGAAASSGTACRASSRVVCVTGSDQGRTVVARIGQRVEVDLDGGLRYSQLHESPPVLLRQLSAPTMEGVTLHATYLAIRLGTTYLQAVGAPECPSGEMCPEYLVLIRVRIHVIR